MDPNTLNPSRGILNYFMASPTDEEQMGRLTHNQTYAPFDTQKLIDAGVLRVTYPGNGRDGGYDNVPEKDRWSLVSLANDAYPDSYTQNWPDKPQSVPDVLSLPFKDLMYDGKYNQVLWSLNKLGYKPEQFFADK